MAKKVKKKTITKRGTMFASKALRERIAELEAELAKPKTDARIKELEELLQRNVTQSREAHDKLQIKIIELTDAENVIKKKYAEEKALAFKTMELDFKEKQMNAVQAVKDEYEKKMQAGLEANFNTLKGSLAKLHEEGNAQTKFTEQIALKMVGALSPGKAKLLKES